MEATTDKEVENTDSKELPVINNPRNIDLEQSRIDTSVGQDPQGEATAIFAEKYETENREVPYTETEAVIDVYTKDEANAGEATFAHDDNKVTSEIEPNLRTDFKFGCKKILTVADSEDEKSNSSTFRDETLFSHDPIDPMCLPESASVNIAGTDGKCTESNMRESEPKEGNDFKKAAAVITQQNYENTLRCQSQDLKSEVIENNSCFQYEDEEDITKEENAFDLSEDTSLEKSDSHEQDVKERKKDNHESFDINQDEKVVTISDDDSSQSANAGETNTKLNSPQGLSDDYANSGSSKMILLDNGSEVIDLDGDESQNSAENSKCIKSTHDNQDEKKHESNIESALISSIVNDVNSKESDSEALDESIKEGKVTNCNANRVDGVGQINDEEIVNTQEKEILLTKHKCSPINSKTKSPNKDLETELKLNGDHQMSPSPIGEPQLNDNTEFCASVEDETRNLKHTDLLTAAHNYALERFDKTPLTASVAEKREVVDDMDYDSDNKYKAVLSRQSEVIESDLNRVNSDDENSRCSSPASEESNSTDTSSLHQLVIDHPMEEIDAGVSEPYIGVESSTSCIKTPEKSEKSNAVKLSLKRKLSSSETGLSPQNKQPHIELESYDDADIVLPQNKEKIESLLELPKEEHATEISEKSYRDAAAECPPFKSLLLQHLQKPYTPPPASDKALEVIAANSLLSQPLDKASYNNILAEMPATVSNHIENIANPTKYLCFKCKTGCFDSFAALNEHQRECLADTRLLPSSLGEIGNLLPILLPPVLATPPPSASPDATVDMSISRAAPETPLSTPIPQSTLETVAQKKRYYKCSSCNTFHENWNLFLHIRDIHQRHMCLYCIRFFPTAEKLSVHLEIKHDLEQNHFNSEEALRKSISIVGGIASETRYLMCCTCQHLFEESEPFSDHNCAEFMKPCTLCGQKGRHSNQCKAHPDAKRTSKTKKKSKKLVHNTTTSVPDRSHNVFSSVSFDGGTSNATSFNCDSNQNSMSTSVAPTEAESAPVAPLHSENSNSSSNMVIDESCTTTHSSLVNPFKELDERWRLEQQAQNQNEPSLIFHARNVSPTSTKLTVPKFKLRVPKEFQKSVDVALSSTDSEDDEDEEENESGTQGETSNYKTDVSVADTTSGLPNESFRLQAGNNYATAAANEQQFSRKRIEDENSQENRPDDKNEWEDGVNPDLVRILQEIERTKLDIQRTKETLHHPPKAKPDTSDEALTTSARNAVNWTPTPPTSPKQASWPTSEDSQKKASSCADLLKPDQEFDQPQQRRDSAGSDAMDIDETITEPSSEQPPRELSEENVQQNNAASTRQELNTSFESNLSVNLLNSSPDTAANPLVREEPTESDSALLKQEHEFPNGDSTPKIEDHTQSTEMKESLPDVSADGIEVANEDVLVVDLQLDQPLEKIEIVEFVRICLKTVYPLCLYCNHARRIAVNGQRLVLHMLAQHRFSATVDSITAEELKPETICAKLKTFLPELENEFFNSTSYCTMGEGAFSRHFNERIFECFQCRFVTSTHKELYLHNRKMHLKTAILCFMCRANFFSFSEILCHICPGAPNKTAVFDVKFRCCLCDVDNIPSPFRLMVHLRKRHFTCDICLEDCRDQGRLSSHVWKHKLHHLCYRCGIAYRNKMDITKHLFWKHGTESIICKRCLQKRWRHVYHFCIPPTTFSCEVCNLCFSKAMYLKVHKRLHNGDLRYPCTEENCEEKFISRKLLLKHTETHLQQEKLAEPLEQSGNSDAREKIAGGDEESIGAKEGCGLVTELNKNENLVDIKKEITECTRETETPAKCEDSENKFKEKAEFNSDVNEDKKNLDLPKGEATTPGEEKKLETPRRRKKKNKRSKESLEDLNLIAPNLSETDSSEESDVDSRSRGDENSLVPKVMLSPPSEAENDLDEVKKSDTDGQQVCDNKDFGENGDSGTGKVMEIWKNFLQSQQSNAGSEVGVETTLKTEADYDDDNYPTPNPLHIVYSDHDYCQMFRPPSPVQPVTVVKSSPLPSLSLTKRNKATKSPRGASTRHSASSSSSESSSSSDSSCSCGSNCSCSSSGSDSSSSSSSSDDSDSTIASNASRKRHRKKSERERLRKKSESVSPHKKHLNSDTAVNAVEGKLAKEITTNAVVERPPSPPKEPQIYESDLETAESETDEDFYDEHPQKLASELLAQKRAQLMAQTRLSPSHNFDIVENSRPSTPSLPEDVVCETTRVKLKKKKRDRKSSCKSNLIANSSLIMKVKNEKNKPLIDIVAPLSSSAMDHIHSYGFAQSSPTVAEPPMAQQPNITMPYSSLILPAVEQLTPRPIAPHMPGRMSEGSSCSDADGSLKRSKRARRPNKFYGYTSDDESAGINLGQSVMIGMRAIKPQPPPQLTWRKEDLPTPSKSIVNQKNRSSRTPKTPGTPLSSLGSEHLNSPAPATSKKKRTAESTEKSSACKRPPKKTSSAKKLPPIPTLKIRPSQLGISNDGSGSGIGTELFPAPQIYSSSKDTDDEDDDNNSSEASSDGEIGAQLVQTNVGQTTSTSNIWNNNLHPSTTSTAMNTQLLPYVAPQPVLPTPQATVFNHKIPPALLPNPNFETLHYFKTNNIRYPIRPPAGARQAREGESVYCYCRCPYDEVSEMIACDGDNCLIEWFHFECVGIMVAPQGKWFCAECRPKYSEELYPTTGNA